MLDELYIFKNIFDSGSIKHPIKPHLQNDFEARCTYRKNSFRRFLFKAWHSCVPVVIDSNSICDYRSKSGLGYEEILVMFVDAIVKFLFPGMAGNIFPPISFGSPKHKDYNPDYNTIGPNFVPRHQGSNIIGSCE